MKPQKLQNNSPHLLFRQLGLTLKIIFGLILIGVISCSPQNSPEISKNIKPDELLKIDHSKITPSVVVDRVLPQQTAWQNVIKVNGQIAPANEIIIGAEINGYPVEKVFVNVGSKVKQGQVLAKLKTTQITNELKSAQAGYKEAQTSLLEAQANFARAEKLIQEKLITQADFERAKSAQEAVIARMENNKALLSAAKYKLEKATITAPFAGIISRKSINVGTVAMMSAEMFRIIAENKLEWRGGISIEDSRYVEEGANVNIFINEHKSINGKVRQIAPEINQNNQELTVYVDLERDGENGTAKNKIVSGSFLRGEIQTLEQPVLAIPANAIFFRDGHNYVYVIDQNNDLINYGKAQISAKKVTIINRKDKFVAIEGISGSEMVVISGVAFLRDGEFVGLKKEGGNIKLK